MITRRGILKAFGIGSVAALTGASIALESPLRTLIPSKGITTSSGPNVVTVHSILDLPLPINGVITLESGTTYNMMEPINLGNLSLEARNLTLNGHHKGDMFTTDYTPEVDIKNTDALTKDYLASSIRAINNA